MSPVPTLLDEEALQEAYGTAQGFGQLLLEKLGIAPYLNDLNQAVSGIDPAYTTALSGGMGQIGPAGQALLQPTRLGDMLSRYRALSESPLWNTMGRTQKLRTLRGVNNMRTPELESAIKLSREAKVASEPLKGLSGLHKTGYLKDLLKGK